MKRISVVIPTLNREKCLVDTIEYFLEKERYPSLDIIIIDQSDTHLAETTAYLRSIANRINYQAVSYKSLTKARNHGIRLASGDIILFVDDDVVPFDGFVQAHVEGYTSSDVAGVTGPSPRPGQQLLSRCEVTEAKLVDLGPGEAR